MNKDGRSKQRILKIGCALSLFIVLSVSLVPTNIGQLYSFASSPTLQCAPYSYIVQPGDTPAKIAQIFGISWSNISEANNYIHSISTFEPLVIPDVCAHPPASNYATNSTTSSPLISSTGPRYVIIRFDDGYQDQYLRALPVLQKDNLPAAFMAITSSVQNGTIPKRVLYDWEYMSWQEIGTLYNDGYEIVDHSATHPDLNQVSASQLQYQIVDSRQVMLSHGIKNVTDFALPYGDGGDNATVSSLIYDTGFTHIWNAYPPQQGILNYTTLSSTWYPIDYADSDLSFSQFKSFASLASSTNVVGFEFHRIEVNTSWVNSTNPYSITLAQFKKDMAYLKNNGYTVVLPTKLPGYNGTGQGSTGSVTISPLPVSMNPGQTAETALTVTNTESYSVTLQSLTNFLSSGYPNVVAWMTTSSQLPATVAADSSYEISITVQTSSSTSAGTYYLTGQINVSNGLAPTFSIPVSVS